jgi:DNA-binding HxlR family transcriptional regulator
MNNNNDCPLHYAMQLIGAKWKPLALFHLVDGEEQSGVLQKQITRISNKRFTQTIR